MSVCTCERAGETPQRRSEHCIRHTAPTNKLGVSSGKLVDRSYTCRAALEQVGGSIGRLRRRERCPLSLRSLLAVISNDGVVNTHRVSRVRRLVSRMPFP